MMAPQFERARLLGVAIQHATNELMEPIDRIEVGARHVVAWAGSRSLTMKYHHASSTGPDGSPMPGSGQWLVETVDAH